jgi:hypothetical protein
MSVIVPPVVLQLTVTSAVSFVVVSATAVKSTG